MSDLTLIPSVFDGRQREYKLTASFGMYFRLSIREPVTLRLLTPCCGEELAAYRECSLCRQIVHFHSLLYQRETVGKWSDALPLWLTTFGPWDPLEAALQAGSVALLVERLTEDLTVRTEKAIERELAHLKASARRNWPHDTPEARARMDLWLEGFVNE